MAWFTLKVQPAHEGRIRQALLRRFEEEGFDVKVGLPTVHSHDALSERKQPRRGRWGKFLKVRPGFLFIRWNDTDLEPMVEVLAATRGVGAIDCLANVPRQVPDDLAKLLDGGTFLGLGVEEGGGRGIRL